MFGSWVVLDVIAVKNLVAEIIFHLACVETLTRLLIKIEQCLTSIKLQINQKKVVSADCVCRLRSVHGNHHILDERT